MNDAISSTKSINFGRVLLGALEVLGAVAEANNRYENAAITQSSEDSKWEMRKLEALSSIERAVHIQLDKAAGMGRLYARTKASSIQARAEELRMEVRKQARERSDFWMSQVEEKISSFARHGF